MRSIILKSIAIATVLCMSTVAGKTRPEPKKAEEKKPDVSEHPEIRRFLGDSVVLSDWSKGDTRAPWETVLSKDLVKAIPQLKGIAIVPVNYFEAESPICCAAYTGMGGDEFERRHNEKFTEQIQSYFAERTFAVIDRLDSQEYDFEQGGYPILSAHFAWSGKTLETAKVDTIVYLPEATAEGINKAKKSQTVSVICKFTMGHGIENDDYALGYSIRRFMTENGECAIWDGKVLHTSIEPKKAE